MSGCEGPLGTQRVMGVRPAGKNIFMPDCRVVDQDVRFAPSASQQSDHELHRQTCTSNNRLAGQDVWIEDNERMLCVHFGRFPIQTNMAWNTLAREVLVETAAVPGRPEAPAPTYYNLPVYFVLAFSLTFR